MLFSFVLASPYQKFKGAVYEYLVGLKHNNHVYIASDSQITVGEYKKPIRSVKSNKIWLPKIVFGTVGFVRERNVLQASSELINHQTYSQAKTFDIHYIFNAIIPEMFELYEKHKILPESKRMRKLNKKYLLAIRDANKSSRLSD